MFLHMEYQVTLPNHDFVVAPKPKLTSSVIGDMKLVKSKDLTNDVVTYSGATYIGIKTFSIIYIRSFSRYDEGALSA